MSAAPFQPLIAQTLGDVLAGADAEKALSRALRAHPELGSRERATLARRVLGVACLRARLSVFLDAACLPPRDPLLLALVHAVHEERLDPARVAAELDLDPAVAQRVARAVPTWPDDPVDRLAAQESLPRWLAALWIAELSLDEARALAAATNRPGPIALRANRLRIDRDSLARALAAERIATVPSALAPDGLLVQGRANLFGSQAWREGLFEIQDEGSQHVAQACAPRPGERWLDLCAGAGGKTLAIAALLGNAGELWASDVDARRLDNLRARLRRSGARSRVIPLQPGREREALGGERFDGVLVDAPCSELGTLRRHPGARWRIEPPALDALPPLQRRLLEIAAELVHPRGRVVYATCTLRHAENEGVARSLPLRWDETTLLPHRHGCDGFFVATSTLVGI